MLELTDKAKLQNQKRVLLAIEVKVPYEQGPRDRYRWEKSVEVLFDLIHERGLHEFCFIQSFYHPAVKAYERKAADKAVCVNTMYLESYFYYDQLSCNINEMKNTQGDGSNMQIHMVT